MEARIIVLVERGDSAAEARVRALLPGATVTTEKRRSQIPDKRRKTEMREVDQRKVARRQAPLLTFRGVICA